MNCDGPSQPSLAFPTGQCASQEACDNLIHRAGNERLEIQGLQTVFRTRRPNNAACESCASVRCLFFSQVLSMPAGRRSQSGLLQSELVQGRQTASLLTTPALGCSPSKSSLLSKEPLAHQLGLSQQGCSWLGSFKVQPI